jgi:hypothetical protein
MKTINLITCLFIIAMICCPLYAKTPEYFCTLTNDTQTGLNTYEFDIYLVRLGTTPLELSGFQAGLTFNTAILNGGTVSWMIIPGSSQLNVFQTPQSFVVDNSVGVLKMPSRTPPGAGNGTLISNSLPGTKIGRFKITLNGASGGTFGPVPINIQWCFDISKYRSVVSAYVSGINVDITQQAFHFNDLSNPALPIQLSSFAAIQNPIGVGVKLEWSTISEINNLGFNIQRYNNIPHSFDNIGFVAGKGTTLEPQVYSFVDEEAYGSEVKYRLEQVDNNGLKHYTNTILVKLNPNGIKNAETVPAVFKLCQNYPNPFNPTTRISFSLSENNYTTLKMFNILGEEVALLFDGNAEAGKLYVINYDASNLPSGLYIYKLQSGKNVEPKKMVLIK